MFIIFLLSLKFDSEVLFVDIINLCRVGYSSYIIYAWAQDNSLLEKQFANVLILQTFFNLCICESIMKVLLIRSKKSCSIFFLNFFPDDVEFPVYYRFILFLILTSIISVSFFNSSIILYFSSNGCKLQNY